MSVCERDIGAEGGGWKVGGGTDQKMCVRADVREICVLLIINPRCGAYDSSADVPSKSAQNGSVLSCRNMFDCSFVFFFQQYWAQKKHCV